MATGDAYLKYGAISTATCTLTSLAHTAGRESTVINNTTGYTDYTMLVQLHSTTGTHGSDQACYVWFYGAAATAAGDYPSPVTGTNAAVTMPGTSGPDGLLLGAVVPFGTSTVGQITAKKLIPSVAAIFGGNTPQYWGVVIENKLNIALSATAGNQIISYAPMYIQVTT